MRSRLRITKDGQLEIVDPDFEDMDLSLEIDESFKIKKSPLEGFLSPVIHKTRSIPTIFNHEDLKEHDSKGFIAFHNIGLSVFSLVPDYYPPLKPSQASFLDLKIELARRRMEKCDLCARNCQVNRLQNEKGVCGLGEDTKVSSHFVHIAEEAPINPSLLISLAGCGLRCIFCQQWPSLNVTECEGESLNESLWEKLDLKGARSLSFIGGNPDESLYAILKFLSKITENWVLPIGWNTHAYVNPESVNLLAGVADFYIPDFKYGSDICGISLSGISGYPGIAEKAIQKMLAQEVPVFVRVLVLPGHLDCCHKPVLKKLSKMENQEWLFVSIRGQYCPDWKITNEDGELNRRTTKTEYDAVHEYAETLGLKIID